jgi:hypothetical protein
MRFQFYAGLHFSEVVAAQAFTVILYMHGYARLCMKTGRTVFLFFTARVGGTIQLVANVINTYKCLDARAGEIIGPFGTLISLPSLRERGASRRLGRGRRGKPVLDSILQSLGRLSYNKRQDKIHG